MHDIQTIHTNNNPITTANNVDFGEFYNMFINYIDASENTIKTYTRAIKQFIKFMYDNGVTQPKREDILRYRQTLLEDGKKASTIQNYIIAIRQLFNFTEAKGLYPNIAKGVKGAKISKSHKKDYLTSKQAGSVLNRINTDDLKGLRDYAIVALMLTGGLRTIEVSRANIEDMRAVGDSTALYIQGKGRDDRTEYIKVIAEVEEAIRAYLSARGQTDFKAPLFASTSNNNAGERMTTRSISGIVKTALVDAGFNNDRLTAHSLRHTAGTLNLLNGGTLEETQQLLRHQNIGTTMIYLHHLEREKNNSEARIGKAIFK
ncbi:tyrosine-type recombinase/integrase [Facklamia sp. P13069]|uniref:tyrosine-type recombinase/integrase n=1 Tax=Facklamia sp. P13069 TaxID=3421954 RepID=UPI003D17DB1D